MKKNMVLAVILSLMFPGLGHLYLGKVLKGFIFIAVNIVSILLLSIGIGVIIFLINWIYSIVDSVRSTRILNEQVPANSGI